MFFVSEAIILFTEEQVEVDGCDTHSYECSFSGFSCPPQGCQLCLGGQDEWYREGLVGLNEKVYIMSETHVHDGVNINVVKKL